MRLKNATRVAFVIPHPYRYRAAVENSGLKAIAPQKAIARLDCVSACLVGGHL